MDVAGWQRDVDAAIEAPTPENIAILVSLLRDPATGEMPRQAVAEALGRTGHTDAVQALQTALTDAG